MQYVFPLDDVVGRPAQLVGETAEALGTMQALGLPVPPGFVVTAPVGRRYLRSGDMLDGAWDEICEAVAAVAALRAARGFPAILAVRPSPPRSLGGALASMPVVGVTRDSLDRLEMSSGSGLADRLRLRFLERLAATRLVPIDRVAAVMGAAGGPADPERAADALEGLIVEESQRPIPETLEGQLREAIETVFGSWDSSKAASERRRRALDNEGGTAVVVQATVFGDLDAESGAGIAYSRDPATGEAGITGRFLAEAHGSDLSTTALDHLEGLGRRHPSAHAGVIDALDLLEREVRDARRVDFVVERGALWLVHQRPLDGTPRAAIRVVVDLVSELLISKEEAVLRIDPASLDILLHPRLVSSGVVEPLTAGTPASPGAASGTIVFAAEEAEAAAREGQRIILVRPEAGPEDLDGVAAAEGVLTSHGGRTSHAAVIARGMGKPAVAGVPDMDIDVEAGVTTIGGVTFRTGDTITIDGGSGRVFAGALPIEQAGSAPGLDTLLAWADEFRTLQVWANADTAAAGRLARVAGAEGVGLARTEYMFLGGRLDVVRRMILADDARERDDALAQLEDAQVDDFERLLEAMDGLPVVVRLLDPPLHEFLPDRIEIEAELRRHADEGLPTAHLERMEAALARLEEANPMLGLRGVRLAVVIPGIYRIQVLAALEAVRRRLDAGGDPRLQVMVPLVGSAEELHMIREMIQEEVHYAGRQLEVTIGTMIELPRAALIAAEIALESDFFSFGTNDLTQTTLGLSRDDAEEAFLRLYLERGILRRDPFQTIDPDGVGRLIEIAVAEGRRVNPDLEIGICGEHGGDPDSISFFHRVGLDYVSCSPPRIPAARLAAAQAALR